jgi:hypothetical protein
MVNTPCDVNIGNTRRGRYGPGMRHRHFLTMLGIGMLLHAAGVVAASPPEIGTETGRMYPDFLLPDLDGGVGRLSDYRGQKVLLIQFASW